MDKNKTKQQNHEGPTARTSKRIAFFLLSLFAGCLVATLLAAIFGDPSNSGIWFELFKNGFVLLSGALTTVIGYYFGSQGIQEAEAGLEDAKREAERLRGELTKEKRKSDDQGSPTYDEVSLEKPPEE